MMFVRIFSFCIAFVGALKFEGHGVHEETLDNLVFGDEALINEKYPVRSVTACALFCKKNAECMAFTVNTSVRKCRLYRSGVLRAADGTADADWKYYTYGVAKCPLKDGFIYSRKYKMCVHVSPDQAYLYGSGKQYCLDKGSSLISLNTTEKVTGIAEIMSMETRSGFSFFIGLSHSNGHWRWENGDVLGPEANWGVNRPRAGTGFYCAHSKRNWGYKYEDHACQSYPAWVVCEFPVQ